MGARIVRRRDLVERGVAALRDAQSALAAGDRNGSDCLVDIANAYARLADALGESTLSEYRRPQPGGNW